jgi:hypothetical protein
MKTYHGMRRPDGSVEVWIAEGSNCTMLEPERSQKVRNHSPAGFEWGYGGSGPAQLALAILLDLVPSLAEGRYQKFKFDKIAGLPHDEWHMTAQEIADWVGGKDAEELLAQQAESAAIAAEAEAAVKEFMSEFHEYKPGEERAG